MANVEDEKKLDDATDHSQMVDRLLSAAMSGNHDEIKKLLSNSDLDVNAVDDKGNSAFHWAAYFDEVGVMKLLMTHPNIDISLQSNRGNTILHLAAVANATRSLQYLTTLGTKESELLINVQNNWGETALHLAASTGKVEAIQILCSKENIDITICDNWNRTALRVAHENIETDAINLLSKYCTAEVIADAVKVEESRMKLGKEVEADKDQRGGLHKEHNEQMMREFMNEMQILQRRMKETMSLDQINVQHAFDVGGKVVEKQTVNKDQGRNDIDDEDGNGNGNGGVPPKQYKFKLGSKFEYGVSPKTKEELEEWLNDDEIDNDGTDLYGWTALHKVIFWQKTEFVEPLLMQMSAEGINAMGPEGETAMMMALGMELNAQKGILELLCQSGKVDLEMKVNGQTVRDMAMQHNANESILEMLSSK